MRKLVRPLVTILVVATLLGGCYLQQGGWMMISPKYHQSRLLGLARDEVVQRLGPATFDPQAWTKRPWNVAEDGPYYLGYYQGWATCTVTFNDGKVDSVRRSWK